jgi:hypothetical protein
VCLGQFRSTRDFAAGVRCLIPAAPAVPAAAAKQQNDKYDDEKRGGIHVELLLAVPCVFFVLRVSTPTTTNPLDPYPFLPSNPTLAASLRLLEHRLDRLPERWAFPVWMLNGWRRLSGAHGVGSWESIDQTCFQSCIEREASAGLTSIALDPQPSPVIPAQHPLQMFLIF